ncbi:unnamed protein product [Vicia faba]|uniref:ABC1 atypical kinase-like domain-containing protein n=1 Tax=Vicia faba TaxID=3906 RepID=A0AAV0YAV7_VICFA|nr:unnamed protein product [Vicia faba]
MAIVEEELRAPIAGIFDRFDYEPIVVASLGNQCFVFLEIDYTKEAANAELFASNFKNMDYVKVPSIYWDYTTPQNRRDRRSGHRKSLQQHHILESLVTWRDADSLAKLVDSVLRSSKQGNSGSGGVHIEEKDKKMSSNVKHNLRKVEDGHFTATVKVLGSSGVAPYNEHTMKALEAKHSYRPPPSMSTTLFSEVLLVTDTDTIFKCIKSFPKGTLCGRDGLRAQHILDVLYGEGYIMAKDLLYPITLVNLWLE